MNSKSGRGALEGFFSGKGFYIVLFLCAAVIGGSAWMLAAGDRSLSQDIQELSQPGLSRRQAETVILPAMEPSLEADRPAMVEAAAPAGEENTQVWREEPAQEAMAEEPAAPAAAPYAWPLSGEVERRHNLESLSYDVTMRDWRTHRGLDIAAALGSTVTAAHAGTVESVRQDDLLGTVVVVSHGDGVQTLYANLADSVAVTQGEWVECGSVIGAVGDSALGEIGQASHLHFAVSVNGVSVDPLDYLPA